MQLKYKSISIILASTLLVILIRPASSYAQSLSACNGISLISHKKVVIDSIVPIGVVSIPRLTDRLCLQMSSVFQSISCSRPADQPLAVMCRQRSPLVDGSQYTDVVISDLNQSDVLLEASGSVTTDIINDTVHSAIVVQCLLVPIRHNIQARPTLSWQTISRDIRIPTALSSGLADSIAAAIAKAPELQVFTLTSLALKYEVNDRRSDAWSTLNQALTTFVRADSSGVLWHWLRDRDEFKFFIINRRDSLQTLLHKESPLYALPGGH